MSFKDLLQRYKDNTATEEEKEIVKQEIEKTRLIQEYLEVEYDLDIALESDFAEENNKEIDSLNSKITKSRRKLITTSVVAALFIMVIFQLVLAPLINKLFYNPTAIRHEESYRDDITLQLDTFSKLHFPDHYMSGAIVENKGIGQYSFTGFLGNKFSADNEYFYGKVSRGKMEFDFNFWTKLSPINIFDLHKSPYYSTSVEETKQKIKDLPPYIYVSAYIAFERDLSMEEFSEIYKEFYGGDLFFNWVGVRDVDAPGHRGPLIGFSPPGAEPWFAELDNSYPRFNISTYIHNNAQSIDGKIFEEHFKDLLQFQIDNRDFLDMLKDRDIVLDYSFGMYYRLVLDYVKENGVHTYGVKVQGRPADILKLTEHEAFSNIIVDAIRLRLP